MVQIGSSRVHGQRFMGRVTRLCRQLLAVYIHLKSCNKSIVSPYVSLEHASLVFIAFSIVFQTHVAGI